MYATTSSKLMIIFFNNFDHLHLNSAKHIQATIATIRIHKYYYINFILTWLFYKTYEQLISTHTQSKST